MIRTLLGALFGGFLGFSSGYLLGYLISPGTQGTDLTAPFLGILAGANLMTVGAIIGGVADIITYLKWLPVGIERERAKTATH